MEQNRRNPWAWMPTLYFAEGLPNVIVTAVAAIMYMQLGMTDTDIALYTGWLNLPWVIKPLWSPFVDLIKTKRWWVLAMQILIGSCLAGVAFTLNTPFWFQGTMACFVLMAFSSATHDISADGYYMIELSAHQQSMFVGIRNTFYRLAVIFGNGLLVPIAGLLQVIFRDRQAFTWSLVFYGLAGLMIALWLWHLRFMPKAKDDVARDSSAGEVFNGLKMALASFFTKVPVRQLVFVLCFLLFYRFPEALLNTITKMFLMRPASQGGLGLSPMEFGLASGTVGLVGLLLGGIIGGILASRDGLKKWLWPMVCAITLPDIIYVILCYWHISNLALVSIGLFIEQFGYGLGFTALTLYMLYYAQGEYKTSHYAFCTGITYLGLMIPGMLSGLLADSMGYLQFFIFVMFCCIITFLVTVFLKIDPEFGKK